MSGRELRARILGRKGEQVKHRRTLQKISVDQTADGEEQRTEEGPTPLLFLRRAEFNLLTYLLENVGQVVSHEDLSTRVFGRTNARDMALVRVHVANLRRKLGPLRGVIRTVPARGYILDVSSLSVLGSGLTAHPFGYASPAPFSPSPKQSAPDATLSAKESAKAMLWNALRVR